MKQIITILLTILSFSVFAQNEHTPYMVQNIVIVNNTPTTHFKIDSTKINNKK